MLSQLSPAFAFSSNRFCRAGETCLGLLKINQILGRLTPRLTPKRLQIGRYAGRGETEFCLVIS